MNNEAGSGDVRDHRTPNSGLVQWSSFPAPAGLSVGWSSQQAPPSAWSPRVPGMPAGGCPAGRQRMKTSVKLEGPVVGTPVAYAFEFISDLEFRSSWGRTKKTVKEPERLEWTCRDFRDANRFVSNDPYRRTFNRHARIG